ncbi:acyl-CoA dehydrogenase family protein [Streptomyces canus]|uniref:acyl-CoA dehydrogenase family protein n=1 Tax=Streptomyces canus TaxID=58343 RepID=UPI00036B152F|nr:acyl-CoA dehydrogenase family protein [Streptomyces canus]
MTTSTAPAVADVEALLDSPAFAQQLAEAEESERIPDELYQECARRGLFALAVPENYGGLGLPLHERIRLHRRVAALSASLQSTLIVHEMAVHAIARYGRSALRQQWFPSMATGETLGAFALSEPDGGSSFDQIRTLAVEDDGGVRVTGTKCWVSSAARAGLFVVFARSRIGSVAVLVERNAPGLTVTAKPSMSAFRATAMATVALQDCPVASEARLGPDGFGMLWVATSCLSVGRVLVAAGALGVASAAHDRMLTHVRQRAVGDRLLADYQLVSHAVARAHVANSAAWLLTEQAAVAIDAHSHDAPTQAIAAKVAAADAVGSATDDALRFEGAGGLVTGSRAVRHALEANVYRTIEGSAEALLTALGGNLIRAHAGAEEGEPV